MAIKFKELSHVYDAGMPYAHVALDKIDLEIKENVVTAIIGHTGSGKSTLVEHLNALLLPSSGSLEILDYNIIANHKNRFLKPLRKDVGLVFQFSEYQLFEESILKDVMFGPINFGMSKQEAEIKAYQALEMVGISKDLFLNSPLELSGGQKRRVAIAGILACDPKVIVLDEPTAGLDPMGAKEIISLFMNLNAKLHKTIIIVTHDNEMVYNYCDETVLLDHGKLLYNGSTLDLFNDSDFIEKHHLVKPQILDFIFMLRQKGFNISKNTRTLEMLASEIRKQI